MHAWACLDLLVRPWHTHTYIHTNIGAHARGFGTAHTWYGAVFVFVAYRAYIGGTSANQGSMKELKHSQEKV